MTDMNNNENNGSEELTLREVAHFERPHESNLRTQPASYAGTRQPCLSPSRERIASVVRQTD